MVSLRLGMFLAFGISSWVAAQTVSPRVRSARVESTAVESENARINVTLKNEGVRPLTAFFLRFYKLDANGGRIPCGGRGLDMIDWSDSMPGKSLYVHMRRRWVPANGSALLDGYPHCVDGLGDLSGVQTEISSIVFEDGTSEGEPTTIDSVLNTRRQLREERKKWIGRFTTLRSAADLKLSAQSLYQDLVDAIRAAEIIPEEASRQGMAKSVREEMKDLALDIFQWASHNPVLQKNEMLAWRVTDLEQRTERVARGAGN
jgi:hypothetical protein